MNWKRDIVGKYLLEWYPRSSNVVAVRTTLLFAAVLLLLTMISKVSYEGQPEKDPDSALEHYLGRHGLIVDSGSIHWISPPEEKPFSDLRGSRVLFLARPENDFIRDFYFAKVKLTPSGKVAGTELWNISETPSFSEHGLWAKSAVAAVAGMGPEGFLSISFYDFSGESAHLTQSWPFIEKVKNSITNYQKTGQLRGINSAFLEFMKPQKNLNIELTDSHFLVTFDEGSARIKISPAGFSAETGKEQNPFEFQTVKKAISGHVPWMVDTARATQIIGIEKIGWAEAKWYRIEDFFKRAFYKIAGSDYAIQSIKEEMGMENEQERETIKDYLAKHAGNIFMDVTPPPAEVLEALDPIEDEGKWKPVLDDVFTLNDDHAPPSLYRTFIRPDPDRPFAHAHLVAWDPRMVEIHVAAGVVEPKSETGRAGTGLIPRDDETMMRLLGGFNGGFQALHGEFGLMQDGKVYLPPKPWAATVAFLKGGKTGFGTWPGPKAGDIPAQIVSYRQNLTPLIQDSKINPYKRTWWGSSPDLNPDSPMIARSGICWTNSNHIVYGLAYSVNQYTYAEAMKRVGCHYLIQLDVNTGHSGFEFIRVTPKNETKTLTKSLDKNWEAEGEVREREDLIFRAKKLFKKMAIMRFPRFIGRDPRDFFYITLTRNLPGPAIAPGKDEVDGWKVKELPFNKFPPSFAFASIHAADRKVVKLVRIDPRWTAIGVKGPSEQPPDQEGAFLTLPPSIKINVSGSPDWSIVEGEEAVIFGFDQLGGEWNVMVDTWKNEYLSAFVKVIAVKIPAEASAGSSPAAGAIGIGPHRFFAWAESSDNNMVTLYKALARAGAHRIIKIPAEAGIAAGWSFIRNEGGEVKPMSLLDKKGLWTEQSGLTFFPADREATVRLFPDTDVVLPKIWNPPQVKRIRYFKPEPDAGVATDGE